MNPNPKVFLKLPLGLNEKQQVNSKNLERGGEKQQNEKESLQVKHCKTISKAT
jgi:hypothetical protein